MKKNKWLILILFLNSTGFVFADVPHGFRYKQNALSISVSVPPAIVYITNSLGERAGVDPSTPLNPDGTQGNGGDSGLTEIPLSHILQMNQPVFDGTDYSSRPYTDWNIEVYDSGPQTYVINLKGLVAGDETVGAYGFYRGKNQSQTRIEFDVFVTPDQLRQINLVFDPVQKSISYQRVVANGDLLYDVKTACKLNLITSDHVCDHLTDKAKSIQDALDNHHDEEAKHLIQSFLCNLGELKGDGDDDRDDHDAIKEPALTILKDDAKALLKTLPDNDNDQQQQ